ncbi:SDR family oxidoreductase [Actinoplanes sp. NBRC 103695]|uniref:SDR family NAD(P)-dependent oxidoreductase n=1 Tax=Actinoplanes sp. NBRC 103695 TaxID=3032202 RepID=UPI0024A2F856|nr:SDR family oxidoreductase [Actinoplanes sp. NBRC 103695]GLZ02501.1 beta-ketoacyl-ACP reductase [Actinoplanes sp. NBRC 103695]
MTLAGQVALVTGSSRGIGRAVASAFAAKGSSVVVNSRSDRSGGEALVEEIIGRGGRAVYHQADVSVAADVETLFDKIENDLGPVDVLVNNAGRTESMAFADATPEHWENMLGTNLMSTVLCSKRAEVSMHGRAGTIINTSSVRGFDANGREAILAYSAAKAAVNNFTRTLAKQLSPRIRVNAVAPGFVATSYMDRVSEEQKQQWLDLIPLQRFITPDEIASVYIFLAEAAFLTGTIVNADAGFTLGRG